MKDKNGSHEPETLFLSRKKVLAFAKVLGPTEGLPGYESLGILRNGYRAFHVNLKLDLHEHSCPT